MALNLPTAQALLDALTEFCAAWQLEVNLEKSAVVALNGTAQQSRHATLYFGPQRAPLTIKDSYRYLGIIIHRTLARGGLRQGMKRVHAAGQAAAWLTMRRCKELHIDEPALFGTLFNQLVMPVLSYGAELWSPWYLPDVLAAPKDSLAECSERVQTRYLRGTA